MERVVSVDLGATSLKAALIDRTGNILCRKTIATSKAGRAAIIEQMVTVIQDLARGESVKAVGIGTPGFVDSKMGSVLLATNIPGWSGTHLAHTLQEHLGLPVVVENDANAAALGEAWKGAGQSLESFIMITLGTGVGGALYSRRTGLWSGSGFRGGEIGHAILYPGGAACACGQKGCVEQYLSGHVLEANYLRRTNKCLSSAEVLAAAANDDVARGIAERFAFDLAVLITSLQNIFDPAGFVIGGGLVHWRATWWSWLARNVREQCVHGGRVCLLPAATGNDAGLYGAAYLAFSNLMGAL